jgi:glutamate--cysteine ligase catalytic subunit
MTISMFPRLGLQDSLAPRAAKACNGTVLYQRTQFPGDVVSKEDRYQAANNNIPTRRAETRPTVLAKFRDKHTDCEPIVLDGTIFGPGHCGLQATFQASDKREARKLHDQLIPLGPIMLALTAATPIYKGFLADTDARWSQISQAVDDRSTEEANGDLHLPPRWYTNTHYLADDPNLRGEYQLSGLAINQQTYERLRKEGFDEIIAQHFAHVFVRDPIVISKQDALMNDTPLALEDESSTKQFDSLNGTIWPHVRLKIPPLDDERIGWRVEFRPMELQLTDFENAAFCVFMALVLRVIKEFQLNFYMPLEQVQENMKRAHERDAVLEARFYFRENYDNSAAEPSFGKITVKEIINGSSQYHGLLPLIEEFLAKNGTSAVNESIRPYLDLVRKRANGELCTGARWMRNFVRSHPRYRDDSVVCPSICYDLMVKINELVQGKDGDASLLPVKRH